ncbi:MAG: hypothetical protein H0Z31_12180 [Bacillus sp. (in: Bacteria)]|nr:hypothetical protein [Bacillus sp. (in: firmicutes)]
MATFFKNRFLINLLHIILDILFLFVTFSYIVNYDQLINQYFPFSVLLLIGSSIFIAYSLITRSMKHYLLVIIYLILLFVGIAIFFTHWLITLVTLIFLVWRINSYFQLEAKLFEVNGGYTLLFYLNLVVAIIVTVYKNQDHLLALLLLLFIFQLTIISIGTMVQRLLLSEKPLSKLKKRNALSLLLFGGFFTLGVGLFILTSPLIKSVFIKFFRKILLVISYAVEIIITFIISLLPKEKMQRNLESLKLKLQEDNVLRPEQFVHHETVSFPIVEIFIALLVVGIIVYLMKKRTSELIFEEETTLVSSQTTKSINDSQHPINRSIVEYSISVGEVREQVLALEQLSMKEGQGRKKFESIRDWFERIGLNETEDFFETYEKVRYGDELIPMEMIEQFKKRVKALKDEHFLEPQKNKRGK